MTRVASVRARAESEYTYDEDTRTYKDAAGAVIAFSTVLAIRDELSDASFADAEDYTTTLEQTLDLNAWQTDMRSLVEETQVGAFMLGRGGINVMGDTETSVLADIVKSQFTYLSVFAAQLLAGQLSVAQAKARADLYMSAASYGFSRGRALAYDDLDLPGYPGDGGTPCLGNCRCAWDIQETNTEYRAWWLASADASECEGCDIRAGDWSPFVQTKADAEAAA